jgi:hypothetical protein
MEAKQGETTRDRFREASTIWSEDECAPDAEDLDSAWLRIFGEPRPPREGCVSFDDEGDALVYEYPGGRFAQVGPPRCGWTEIRVAAAEQGSGGP